jgi:hypothetical protein
MKIVMSNWYSNLDLLLRNIVKRPILKDQNSVLLFIVISYLFGSLEMWLITEIVQKIGIR